jgi:hypothetical protein
MGEIGGRRDQDAILEWWFRMTSMIGDVSSALRLVEETGKRSLRLCCCFFFLANVVMSLGQPAWFTINPHRANSREFVVGVTKVA